MLLRSLVLSLLAAATAGADIDLTPRVRTTQFGTFASSWIQFIDGDRKISLMLDSDTKVSAGEGGAMFTFDGIPKASVRFKRSPLSSAAPFEGETLIQYQKAALAMLPDSAEGVVLDESAANPESINGQRSYRFTFSFEIAQVKMRESILFINIDPAQQIVVQTGAYAKDFDGAADRASSMIRSWHPTTPAEEEGIN